MTELKKNFKCEYCNVSFAREKTLFTHLCEKKRRWQQEKEIPVQLGFRSFNAFRKSMHTNAATYAEFVDNTFYNAFVRFGNYMVSIRAINIDNYLNWLLKNNKKIDIWCQDTVYDEWLIDYLKTEPCDKSLERSLKEMQRYCDEGHIESFFDYFRKGNINVILNHINAGRITPWVIYNSESGIEFLEKLMPEQLETVVKWISPTIWKKILDKNKKDVEWCREVLSDAGL